VLISQLFRGNRQFDAAGRFFSYVECTTPGTRPGVMLMVDGQPVGLLLPGESFELDEDCDRWEIYPLDAACGGRVLIGNGRARSGRVTGSVEAAEAALSSTLAGTEYLGSFVRFAAASLFAAVGITAGTRALAVRRWQVQGSGSNNHRLMRGTGGPTSAPISSRAPATKGAGPAATSIMQTFDCAASTGPITAVTLTEIGNSVVSPCELVTAAPIVLAPNESLWVINLVAAQGTGVHWELTEL
jgi:hypothetical protein